MSLANGYGELRAEPHPSIPRDFWTQWVKYQQSLQQKQKKLHHRRKGHCDRYHQFWSFFGFTLITFISIVVWWITAGHAEGNHDSTQPPWFFLVAIVYILVWRTSTEIRSWRQQTDSRKRHKYSVRLHATWSVLSVMGTPILCALFEWNQIVSIAVAAVAAVLLAAHYTLAFVKLRKLWILPFIFIYFIAVSVMFSLWYFEQPTEAGTDLPLWLLVMICGAGIIILQIVVLFGWNSWGPTLLRWIKSTQAMGGSGTMAGRGTLMSDDEGEESDEDYDVGEASLAGRPLRTDIFPGYDALSMMQAGAVTPQATQAGGRGKHASGNAMGAEHKSIAQYDIGIPISHRGSVNESAIEIEYIGTPLHPHSEDTFDMLTHNSHHLDMVEDVEAEESDDSSAQMVSGLSSSPVVDVYIDVDVFPTPHKSHKASSRIR